MLHSTVPCPPGVRAKKRGASTPDKSQGSQTTHRRTFHKKVTTTCVREGNQAVPALRMYKNRKLLTTPIRRPMSHEAEDEP